MGPLPRRSGPFFCCAGTTEVVKRSALYFVFGVVAGVVTTLVIEKLREETSGEDVADLAEKVAEHLRLLESRLADEGETRTAGAT